MERTWSYCSVGFASFFCNLIANNKMKKQRIATAEEKKVSTK
jgi:hypothetical protein